MKKRRPALAVALVLLGASPWIDSGSAVADAPPARFDAEPFTEEKTPAPAVKEWGNAAPVSLTSTLPSDCAAYRIREWIRIRCKVIITMQLALLGGDPEGVSLYIPPANEAEGVWTKDAEIIFPVRRGDRRMFEWSTAGDSYGGDASIPVGGFVISESFLPGAKAPIIVADSISLLIGEF